MIWIEAKIFLVREKHTEEFVNEYISLYSVEIDGPQNVGGVMLTLEPNEENKVLAVIFLDNRRLALLRKASWFDGTLSPQPVHEPPLAEGESPDSRLPIGYWFTAYWPQNFLDDVRNGQHEGVHIVEEPNE